MRAEDTIIDDELIKVAMSDIKNRWLHSLGEKDTFEHDCFDAIIQTNRFAQAEISFKIGVKEGIQKGRKEIVEWVMEYVFPMIRFDEMPVNFKDRWNEQMKKWEIE